MKIRLVVLVLIVSMTFGCQKENYSGSVQNEQTLENVKLELQVVDGMLSFADETQLYETVAKMNLMTSDERITMGEKYGVKTLQIIADEIARDQNEFELEYYKGIEPGLPLAELEATGKGPAFCETYIDYKTKGIITEVRESDGFYSYHLTLLNPIIAMVANENGAYLVGERIYLRTNEFLAIKKYEGPEDIELLERANHLEDEAITYFDLSNSQRILNEFYLDNIFGDHGTLEDPTWYYDAPNKRFKHYVNFKSVVSEDLLNMNNDFYTLARAERRLFWQWDSGNNYVPIDYLNGSWNYYWYEKNWDTGVVTTIYNDPSGGASSPLFFNPAGTTNLLGCPLQPTGYEFLSPPFRFDSATYISQMLIHGYFIGDTGIYHTNYEY